MSDNSYLMPEYTTWDFPTPACGDWDECHAEPPTCGCN